MLFTLRVRVKAIGAGDLAIPVGFGHQGAVAVQEVGGLGAAALGDALADSAAKGVVAVAYGGAALAQLAQTFGSVVAEGSRALGVGFFLGVALRGVADLGVYGRGGAEGRGLGVLNELVVCVVAPGTSLVGAAGAVADCVVAVLFLGQAFGLQGLVWGSLGKAPQRVIPIVGSTRVAVNAGDVPGQVVLVTASFRYRRTSAARSCAAR